MRFCAVSVPAATPAKLLGAGIDLPKSGLTAAVLTLHVAGWAVGRESPAAAVEILYQPAPRDRPARAGARDPRDADPRPTRRRRGALPRRSIPSRLPLRVARRRDRNVAGFGCG